MAKCTWATDALATGTYGGKTDHVLKLTPKAPSAQYKLLYLVVDPGTSRVDLGFPRTR